MKYIFVIWRREDGYFFFGKYFRQRAVAPGEQPKKETRYPAGGEGIGNCGKAQRITEESTGRCTYTGMAMLIIQF